MPPVQKNKRDMKTIRIFMAAAVAVIAISCGRQQGGSYAALEVGAPEVTQGEIDTVSYLAGVHFGSIMRQSKLADKMSDINVAEFTKGVEDALAAVYGPDFSAQFKVNVDTLYQYIEAYITKKMTYDAALREAQAKAFFAENALREAVDTLPGGLQYEVLAKGSGEKIQKKDTVLVNYKGTLLDGTMFDMNDTTEFALDSLIKGWQEGLCQVSEGAKVKLYVPAEMGYGDKVSPLIPANSALIYEVEILKVNRFADEVKVEE